MTYIFILRKSDLNCHLTLATHPPTTPNPGPSRSRQVTELESSANFPAEMEKFQQVLTRVRESQMAVAIGGGCEVM